MGGEGKHHYYLYYGRRKLSLLYTLISLCQNFFKSPLSLIMLSSLTGKDLCQFPPTNRVNLTTNLQRSTSYKTGG